MKALSKLAMKEKFLNPSKGIYGKPIANIKLNREILGTMKH